MKLFTLCLLFVSSTFAFGQDQTNPGEYMQYFSIENRQIQQDMWDYTRTISHGKSARKVEKTRMTLIETSNKALQKAKQAKGYKGDDTYKESVVNYFNVVNLVLREDYAKLVDMEDVAEQSYDLMEAYMLARELASEKQNEAANKLQAAQKAFANANNINLIEQDDALSKNMEIAGNVYEHYNAVYLIFFKSFKQEVYLLDAIGRSDVSSFEQNRETLLATIEEGKTKLKALTLYSNDPTMVEATKNLFDFYTKEVKESSVVLDFFMKQENFNKVKAAFEQKKEKDRTQADVNQYNAAVNDMNTASTTYNAWNERMNKDRARYIDAWNKTSENFTAKHIPTKK
jgi:hypothetical protein